LRAVLQRVTRAEVRVDGVLVSEVGGGLCDPDLPHRRQYRICGRKAGGQGRFGADTAVSLVIDGPVTIWLDTDRL